MDFKLLGYILAWIGIIYSVGMIVFVFITYRQLPEFQKRMITEIHLSKELITFLLSIGYIITYHIS